MARLISSVILTAALLLALPAWAQTDCSGGDVWGSVLANPPGSDPLGSFIQSVREAAEVAESDPGPQRETYSDLEQAIIDQLHSQTEGVCGNPSLLGMSLNADGTPPPPGFTRGREKSYAIALDVLQRYGYTLLDEDEVGEQVDIEYNAAANNREYWRPDELARLRVVLDTFEPWFGDLDLKVIVRDDYAFFYTPDGPKLHTWGATYWMSREVFPAADGTRSPQELRINNDGRALGCFEKFLIHELLHAWFDKHEQRQKQFETAAGWRSLSSQTPSSATVRDCKGRKYPFRRRQWILPSQRSPSSEKYQNMNALEDSAEQFSYRMIGPAAESLARLNPPGQGDEQAGGCLDFLEGDRPDPEKVIEDLIAEHYEGMPFLAADEWQGIRVGVSTLAELERASQGSWTPVGGDDDGLTRYERKVESAGIERMEIVTEKDRVMAVTNEYGPGERPTREALINALGPPTRTTEGVLYWDERMVSARLEDGEAVRVTYGLWGFHE